MIQLNHVSKSFNGITALKDVNLEIEKGRTYSLIGPSGCGKSTLIRIIIGLLKPDEGRIKINGIELNENNLQDIRQNIGYVIQQGGLFPHLTAKQNCSLVAEHLGGRNITSKSDYDS